jgi:8-amino-7-oxononanoate synthase
MGLFDKFQALAAARRELGALGVDPFGVVIERILSPTEGVIHGRRTVLAGTNNYLGLTFDPDCVAAAQAALAAAASSASAAAAAAR